MKEIEKLENVSETGHEHGKIKDKINEVIDAVNALLITHPRVEESAANRKMFEKEMTSDTSPDAYRAKND